MKKILSMFLVLVMCVLLSISVFASGNENDEGMYVGNIYISSEVKNYIEENGVPISSNDQLKLINSYENGRSLPVTALQISHADKEYIILSYAEQENGNIAASDVPVKMTETRGSSSMSYTPGKGLVTVTGIIGCDATGDPINGVYLYPYINQFSYKKNSACTVNHINTSFQTEGTLCNKNGIEIQKEYVYYINKLEYNPVEGQTYYNYKPLSSDLKILLTNNINSGAWLTFEVSVNGSVSTRTFNMIKAN